MHKRIMFYIVLGIVVVAIGTLMFIVGQQANAGVGPAGFAPAIQQLINTGRSQYVLTHAHEFGWHASCHEVPNYQALSDRVTCVITETGR